jgi:acetoin utilization deacetylase AcuC-like enzyme
MAASPRDAGGMPPIVLVVNENHYEEERGAAAGEGFNRNFPLPASVDGRRYRRALGKAIQAVVDFQPAFLVVALGLDTAEGDPCGTWCLGSDDFRANGRMLGQLRLPTLVVQEGGYRLRTLGTHARSFFEGLLHGIG